MNSILTTWVSKKKKLLTCESVYWVNINTDIEKHIKSCNTCLEIQQTQPKEKIIHYDTPLRPWEMLVADIFHFHNKNYLCIIDYHSKFTVIKRMEGLSTESLITTMVIFAEYGIPCRLMSDAGTNFISEKFRRFCSRLNTEQAMLSVYHHQSNGQVKASIKFIKCTLKNVWTLVVTFPHEFITNLYYTTGARFTQSGSIAVYMV